MLNFNAMERATSVVQTSKILIVWRYNETSNVFTARKMDTRFKNFTTKTNKTSDVRTARKMLTKLKTVISRSSTRKNKRTIIRRVTKKRTT